MGRFFRRKPGGMKKTPFPREKGNGAGKMAGTMGTVPAGVWGMVQKSRIARLESRHCLTQGLQYLARSSVSC